MSTTTLKLLFENVTLGKLVLRNRFMRSPTWEGLAGEQGEMTVELATRMEELAAGHVALTVLSHTFVADAGRAGPRQLGLQRDDNIAGFADACRRVHAAGGLIAVQLNHAGRLAYVAEEQRHGPSANVVRKITDGTELAPCVAATLSDIDDFVAAFVAAAVRAKTAGIDAIMIHAAHGYLISQFLTPAFNARTDDYGCGSLETRARLLLRVVTAVREAVGQDMPLLVKLNTEDFHPQGMTLAESSRLVVWLARAGVCLVEASGGSVIGEFGAIRRGKQSTEAYHREGAQAWMAALKEAGLQGTTKVALVGGIRDARNAEKLVQEGVCDIISLSRPLIRDPDLVRIWETAPDTRSGCISCSRCHEDIRADKGYHCPHKKK